ncbi:MAG: phage head-tail connector protein, partial [Bradyrhizobium sp.]
MLTVITAATKFTLIDTATARSALGFTDNSEDVALNAYIARASDVLARQCKRVFAKETVEETFRLDRCQQEIVLARYPVSSITSIVENGTTLATTDYEADLDKGIITRLYGDRPCHWSTWKIVIAYVAGYELPTETPEALKQAAVQLVKAYHIGGDRDPLVSSETTDN